MLGEWAGLATVPATPVPFEPDQWLRGRVGAAFGQSVRSSSMDDRIVISPLPGQASPSVTKSAPPGPDRRGRRRWLVTGLLLIVATAVGVAWCSMRGGETI